jgi:hypothetical protein
MRETSPQSPEARRKRLASMRAAFGTEVEEKLKPQVTVWEVIKRVAIGVLQRRVHPRRQTLPYLFDPRTLSLLHPGGRRSRICSVRARTPNSPCRSTS